MGDCFIHFGSSVFDQFKNVKLRKKISSSANIFDTLCVDEESYSINNIFIGWSYVIFHADNKLYYYGLKNGSFVTKAIDAEYKNKGDIRKIICGWNELLILTEWKGCFFSEREGLTLTQMDPAVKSRIVDVAMGDKHSILLTTSGRIFSLDHSAGIVIRPLKIRPVVSSVACGKDFVVVLASDGKVFTYGNGSRGQLGHGDVDPRDSPALVEALEGLNIKFVAAGGWHAAAISDIGDLYVWGWNESGQLGLPCAANVAVRSDDAVTFQTIPVPLYFEEEVGITLVSCGSRHTAVLTDDGKVWTWGWNGYGQLGQKGILFSDIPIELELPLDFCVSKVTCAHWSTLIAGTYLLQ